jgi:membrane-bound lytic murein transglycosylase D
MWKTVSVVGGVALLAGCAGQGKPQTPAEARADGGGEYGRNVAERVDRATEAAETQNAVEIPGTMELGPDDDVADPVDVADAGDSAVIEADPAVLLHESLDAFESAGAFWEQGAFDDAFAALDRSYELMAAVPLNGDPVAVQEKENLRVLISRRILEIYASRQTAVGDPDAGIPVIVNADVEAEIKSFQGREREFFIESYRRSGLYRPMIVQKLEKAGLPEQLSWLPLVESGFKDRALSSARALGLWQFIPSTGYRYGLDRSDWIDERMDPEKATDGAIGYLTALHGLFGDWLTALAAYNCGEGAVLKRINGQAVSYFDRFWDLYARLPRETRRYVPRFLATLEILRDPAKYGFELPEPYDARVYETIEIARATQLEALDRVLGLEKGTLAKFNPELRRNAVPAAAYPLKVPVGQGQIVLAKLESLPKWSPPQVSSSVHRVRPGETLSGIASRYGTSVGNLMRMNRLRSANRIWPGQQLNVPGGGGGVTYASTRLSPGSEVRHRVRSGESLWLLASRYGTTVANIQAANGLSGSSLRVGQVLTIRAAGGGGSGSGSGTYIVQRGDTLGKIAAHRGVALSRLLAVNDLSSRSTIYPGQVLTIP